LAWPVFIELFLQFLLGTADTLMVSRVSDDAVAVVGFSANLFAALMTLFMTVAGGAGILIAQRIGAGKVAEARTIAVMSVNISALIGLALSVFLFAAPTTIAAWLQLPERLYPLAQTYISIVGGGMVLTALMSALSAAIRNTGNTKAPMVTALGMNVIHLFMNYGFIFGAYGFPQWGLTGVAVSTLSSRLLATCLLLAIFVRTFEPPIRFADLKLFDRRLFGDILRIGWPMGVNTSAWCFTQLTLSSFIAILGAQQLAARTYMNTLESFCFMLGFSIAMAVQIRIAHLYGARRTREAYKSAYSALGIGLALVLANAALLVLFGTKVLGWFTSDSAIIGLCVPLLWLNLLLQPAKMLNMAIGNSLNAVGDTRFMMVNSMLSMWIVGVGIAYVTGIHFGWGLIGIYASMISDELLRGIVVLVRWRRQKYLRRAEASADPERAAAQGQGMTLHG
jgi:putative MATE family efflux protein